MCIWYTYSCSMQVGNLVCDTIVLFWFLDPSIRTDRDYHHPQIDTDDHR